MINDFFKTCGIVLGSALTIYVGKELIKEYDSTVEENNRLREFIDSHDFYEVYLRFLRQHRWMAYMFNLLDNFQGFLVK